MSRLLQGDVGSGKTVVAAAALLATARAGLQGAIMAPTEILAEQHARTLTAMLEPHGVKVALLTGSLTKAQRARIYLDAADRARPGTGRHPCADPGRLQLQGTWAWRSWTSSTASAWCSAPRSRERASIHTCW